MISIMFAGKVVMAMHVVTIEHRKESKEFTISLSNGLVLSEGYETDEQKLAIARKLSFDGSAK